MDPQSAPHTLSHVPQGIEASTVILEVSLKAQPSNNFKTIIHKVKS